MYLKRTVSIEELRSDCGLSMKFEFSEYDVCMHTEKDHNIKQNLYNIVIGDKCNLQDKIEDLKPMEK